MAISTPVLSIVFRTSVQHIDSVNAITDHDVLDLSCKLELQTV
jgi:hypothetical protein